MFKLLVALSFGIAAMTGRWEIAIGMGALYLFCRKADKYE